MLTPTLLNNRYRVLRILGDGGFGETFLAEDTQMPSGRRCLIKQLKPVVNNPQVYQLVQERFRREAAILEELGNGCNQIPTLYAYFVEDGEFYLVQEYIEGQTLTQILQQGLLSESSVKEILINILPVLDYVHSKGIVHRDIKPDNILIRNCDRKPVLIDFGAVKETMGTTVTASGNSAQSIVIGTPGFMPMEQSVGRPIFASDIYSLGLTAIYLLTGKIPQEFTTNPVTGEIVWRNFALGVTPTFAGILDKSIQPIGRDRYWNAREMLSALQASQTPLPLTAPIYPVAAPTVPSSPPPQVHTPTVLSPPAPQSTPTAELQPRGLGTWQQAIIIGGVIGLFVVSGLWVMQLLARNSLEINPNPPNANLTPTSTASQTPTTPIITSAAPVPPITSIPPQTPAIRNQNPITLNPASISQNSAEQAIRNWLTAKRDIFGSEHHAELGTQLLTGKAFRDNIRKTDDPDACIAQGIHEDNCLSSVDWLIRNNAYYSYGVQKIEQIRNFSASGENATIEVDVTEERTLYKNGKIDRNNTAFKTSRVRYSLVYENGFVKISDYKTLN
ncbi:serine/threonine protein kinase [Calothrix sp. NIES-4101]|nr:serine/threonine protein kinase [Calothrix sp. NIES-4101]